MSVPQTGSISGRVLVVCCHLLCSPYKLVWSEVSDKGNALTTSQAPHYPRQWQELVSQTPTPRTSTCANTARHRTSTQPAQQTCQMILLKWTVWMWVARVVSRVTKTKTGVWGVTAGREFFPDFLNVYILITIPKLVPNLSIFVSVTRKLPRNFPFF